MAKSTFATSDKTHVLMSDDLQGQVPELDDVGKYESNFILFVANLTVVRPSGEAVQLPQFVSNVISALADTEPEFELRTSVPEAHDIMKLAYGGNKVIFDNICLDNGANSAPVGGPYVMSLVRLQDIDNERAMCVLSMKLQRV